MVVVVVVVIVVVVVVVVVKLIDNFEMNIWNKIWSKDL